MNLWIRSQDKKILTPINEKLEIVIGKYVKSTISEYRSKQFYEIYYKDNKLGEYLTKERALEVLDEIQNHTILNQCVPPEHRFYEMPKE